MLVSSFTPFAASGLSAQQRLVQQQLAALEEEDEQSTSLFQPRGAGAGASAVGGAGAAAATVTSSNATSQYTKSVHIKNQLAWHTNLLNLRIRVQGVLADANRLPASCSAVVAESSGATSTAASTTSSDASSPAEVRAGFERASSEVAPAYSAAMKGARKLLDELFELQQGLMLQNTKIFAPASAGDDDEEQEDAPQDRIPKWEGVGKRKRAEAEAEADEEEETEDDASATTTAEGADALLGAYWSHMHGRVTPFFTPIQNALIDKWNTKTQLSAGQLHAGGSAGQAAPKAGTASALGGLKVINQSVLSQIEQLMLDEGRLVKRSQLHRTAGATSAEATALLGRVELEQARLAKRAADAERRHRHSGVEDADADALRFADAAEVYDGSIYDDNDHYQQLLAEIISAASAAALDGSGGSGASGGHDADLLAKAAAARRKNKKGASVVDRRASKGRKMRYTVHAKLANFMAPRPAPIADDYAARAAGGDRNDNLLSGSGFAMDELFTNLFGGAGKIVQSTA